MGLGGFPIQTADKARKAARKILVQVVDGADPAALKQAHREAPTVAEMCDDYFDACDKGLVLARNGQSKKPLTIYTDKGRVERHVKPLIGRLKAADVTRADIERMKAGIVTGKTATDEKTGKRGRAIVTGGRGAATRTLGLLGSIFQWGIDAGFVKVNPVRGVKRFKDGQRKAMLTDDQYTALGAALDALEAKKDRHGQPKHHPYGLAALRFIALTGVRRGEAQGLTWNEVDLPGCALRLGDTKTGESIRPLGKAARDLLEGLERVSEHVFPAGPGAEGYQGLPRLWRLVQSTARSAAEGGESTGPIDTVTLHSLRHSFAGTAESLDCSMPTIAALLGHRLAGVTAGYVLKRLDKPLIASADRVAGHVDRVMRGAVLGDNVVALEAISG
jgi:integrase